MEQVGKLLKLAEREKSLTTTQQPSQPSWAGLLWTLAQSKYKELTAAEVSLWKAKLSAYPNDLVEWALLNFNEEFLNPGAVCRMIEVKRESMFAEHQNREGQAYKANQKQAEQEGQMATQEQYDELRETFRKIAFGPPLVKMNPIKGVGHGKGSEAVDRAVSKDDGCGDSGAGAVPTSAGCSSQENPQKPVTQADV